jgi:hypothetical protein
MCGLRWLTCGGRPTRSEALKTPAVLRAALLEHFSVLVTSNVRELDQ